MGVTAAHLEPWQVGALVLAGGAVAWLAQTAGSSAARDVRSGPPALRLATALRTGAMPPAIRDAPDVVATALFEAARQDAS